MFCSDSYAYLSNQSHCNNIYNYMSSLFYKPAFIDFYIECYHFETRIEYRRRSDKASIRTRNVRVNTYDESYSFKYMTWRDVSGPFYLNTDEYKKHQGRVLVKLKLSLDIEFANDGTVSDFEAQKKYFVNRNKHRDTNYDFSQSNRVDGFNEYNLVHIGETPPSIGVCWMILSTILCVLEFYKLYINSFCVRQEFKILKLVSTRTNFYLPETFEPYLQRVPRIVFIEKTTFFDDPSKLGEVTEVPELPALEEIVETNKPEKSGESSSEDAKNQVILMRNNINAEKGALIVDTSSQNKKNANEGVEIPMTKSVTKETDV